MPNYRTILTAHHVDGCPLYKTGDKMFLNLPEIDMEATGKVCAFIIAEFLRKRLRQSAQPACKSNEEFANAQAYSEEFQIPPSMIYCPRVDFEVSFLVEVKEKSEDMPLLEHEEFRGFEDSLALATRLQKIPIFSSVAAEDILDVLADLKVRKCQTGDIIIEKGQPGRYLFILYNGQAEVVHQQSVIGQLKSGDCFGEMSLLTGEPISATIRTSAPSVILKLDRLACRKLLEHAPQMSLMFTKVLAERIKAVNQRMAMVVASGMVGQLQTLPFPELLQSICATDATGILHLNHEGSEGKIYIRHQQLVHITLGQNQGPECFYEMVQWKTGNFRFEQKEFEKYATAYDPMSLLLEGMRRLDEGISATQ